MESGHNVFLNTFSICIETIKNKKVTKYVLDWCVFVVRIESQFNIGKRNVQYYEQPLNPSKSTFTKTV